MLMGIVILIVVAWTLAGSMDTGDSNLDEIFLVVVPAFSLTALIASQLLFKLKINSIDPSIHLPQKLLAYKEALIIKYALIEGPAILACIAFLLTANTLHLAIAGILLLFFVYNRPDKSRLLLDLNLTADDAALFAG